MIWTDVLLFLVLLLIAVIDLRTKYIYDFHLLIAVVITFIGNLSKPILMQFLGAAVGFTIGYAIYRIAFWWYKQEAFGFGDVLLLGVLGFYFGWPDFLSYFAVVNMGAGILAIIVILVYRKALYMQVPMAPVFIFGAYIFKWFDCPDLYQVFAMASSFYYTYLRGICS